MVQFPKPKLSRIVRTWYKINTALKKVEAICFTKPYSKILLEDTGAVNNKPTSAMVNKVEPVESPLDTKEIKKNSATPATIRYNTRTSWKVLRCPVFPPVKTEALIINTMLPIIIRYRINRAGFFLRLKILFFNVVSNKYTSAFIITPIRVLWHAYKSIVESVFLSTFTPLPPTPCSFP